MFGYDGAHFPFMLKVVTLMQKGMQYVIVRYDVSPVVDVVHFSDIYRAFALEAFA